MLKYALTLRNLHGSHVIKIMIKKDQYGVVKKEVERFKLVLKVKNDIKYIHNL